MWGVDSNPARFGYGQSATDDRNLFMKVFSGEVLAAYQKLVQMADKVKTKQISSGKSWQWPKTWKATGEYHTAGREMLGNDIDTTEVVITLDGLLVAHTAIYDLDKKMAHFDVTSEFSMELGRELARHDDKNAMRGVILAARTAADGPFPAGHVITDASLVNTGAIDGAAWIDAIRDANLQLFNDDVPEDLPRYAMVNAAVFDAIKYARDSNGHYLLLNRDINPSQSNTGAIAGRATRSLDVDGVTLLRDRDMPRTDETAVETVYPKYRADYSTTTGILWTPGAVGKVNLMGVTMESERDVRRQEDFMVAKMAVGYGTLRAEGAVEFKTA